MSVIADLRAATWQSHQRLEKRMDVAERFGQLEAYRAHLQRMYGFCASLEAQCDALQLEQALSDYAQRRKCALIERDLLALGAAPGQCLQLPHCRSLGACTEPAAALGSLYVLEGATLGGRTLLPLVRARLGFTAERGAAFLASYGDAVDAMWRRFSSALDAWCTQPGRTACATNAAVATFAALEGWLCGSCA
jgi:heme oxygenase